MGGTLLIADQRQPPPRIHAHHHAVQFYGDEGELFKTIGSVLIEGLVANQPAVVIATPPHTAAIIAHERRAAGG